MSAHVSPPRPSSARRGLPKSPSTAYVRSATAPARAPAVAVQRPRVFIRLKPTDGATIFKRVHQAGSLDRLYCHYADPGIVHKQEEDINKIFSGWGWDRVFEADATQAEIFDAIGTEAIDWLQKKINTTLFAYGQTGSGKTYTIQGPSGPAGSEIRPDMGLVPRLLHRIYERFGARRAAHEVLEFQLSFRLVEFGVEAKLETLRDLLQREAGQPRLLVRHKKNLHAGDVPGARVVRPNSFSEAVRLYLDGCKHRTTASTEMNNESSRSHALLMLTVRWTEHSEWGDEAVREAGINVLDLAGSEDPKKSMATGYVLDQAIFINQTLSVLNQTLHMLAIAARSTNQTSKTQLIDQARRTSANTMLTKVLVPFFSGDDMIQLVVNAHNDPPQQSESVRAVRFGCSCLALPLNPRARPDVENITDMQAAIAQSNEELMRERLRRTEAEQSRAALQQENEALRQQQQAEAAANALMLARPVQSATPGESELLKQQLESLQSRLDTIMAQMAAQAEELAVLRARRDEDDVGRARREALEAELADMEEQKHGLQSILEQSRRNSGEHERLWEEEKRKRVETEQNLQQRLVEVQAENAALERQTRAASEAQKNAELEQRQKEERWAEQRQELVERLERMYEARYDDDFEEDEEDDDDDNMVSTFELSSAPGANRRGSAIVRTQTSCSTGSIAAPGKLTLTGGSMAASTIAPMAMQNSASIEERVHHPGRSGNSTATGTQTSGLTEASSATTAAGLGMPPSLSKQSSWRSGSTDTERSVQVTIVQEELSAVRARLERLEEGSDAWRDEARRELFFSEILQKISSGLSINIELPTAQITALQREVGLAKNEAAAARAEAEATVRQLRDNQREVVRIQEEKRWRQLRDKEIVDGAMLEPAVVLLIKAKQKLSSEYDTQQDLELRLIRDLFPEVKASNDLRSLIRIDTTVVSRFQRLGGIALLLRLIAAEIEIKQRNEHWTYNRATNMVWALGYLMDAAGQAAFVEARPELQAWLVFLKDADDDNIHNTCEGIAKIAHGCEVTRKMLRDAGLGEAVFQVLQCQKERQMERGATKEVRQDLQSSSLLALSALVEQHAAFRQDMLRVDAPQLIVSLLDKRSAVPNVIKNALLTLVHMTHNAPDVQDALLRSASKSFQLPEGRPASIMDVFNELLFDAELAIDDADIHRHAANALLNVVKDVQQAVTLLYGHPCSRELHFELMLAMCRTLEKRAETLGARVQTRMSIGGAACEREFFGVSVKGMWDETSAGGSTSATSFLDNPQLLLEAKPGTSFVLVLTDRDYVQRKASKVRFETIYLSMRIMPASTATVDFSRAQMNVEHLPQGSRTEGRQRTHELADGCYQTPTLVRSPSNEMFCHVDQAATTSHWVIVPHTSTPAQHTRFSLTVFADAEVRLTQLSAWQKHTLCSRWTTETSAEVDCTEPGWRCCPQFLIVNHGLAECDALALLRYEELETHHAAGLLLNKTEADKKLESQAVASLAQLPNFELSMVQSNTAMRYLSSNWTSLQTGTNWTRTYEECEYRFQTTLPMRLSAAGTQLGEGEQQKHQMLLALANAHASRPVGFRLVVYSAPSTTANISLQPLAQAHEWLTHTFSGGTDSEGVASLVVEAGANTSIIKVQLLIRGDDSCWFQVQVVQEATGEDLYDESQSVSPAGSHRGADGITCFDLPNLNARRKYVIKIVARLKQPAAAGKGVERAPRELQVVLCTSAAVVARPSPGCALQGGLPRPPWLGQDGVVAWPVGADEAGKAAPATTPSKVDEVQRMLSALASKEAVVEAATNVIRQLERQRDELVKTVRAGSDEQSLWMAQIAQPEAPSPVPPRKVPSRQGSFTGAASVKHEEQEKVLLRQLKRAGFAVEDEAQHQQVREMAQLGLDDKDAFKRLSQRLPKQGGPSGVNAGLRTSQLDHGKATAPAAERPEKVKITVTRAEAEGVLFILNRGLKLGKLLNNYCERQQLPRDSVSFMTKMGKPVQPSDTADSLDLSDEDEIKACINDDSSDEDD